MSKTILELKNIYKTYSNGEVSLDALKNINLKINEHDFISVIGPSGSGKSTLLHIMGLLDLPTKGEVFLKGKPISNLSEEKLARIRNKYLGFVFQVFNLIPTLNAVENVAMPLTIMGVGKAEREQRAKELLTRLGLGNRLDHYPSELSGGQRQRVAIARALINNPSLILADEPTGNLDSKSGAEVIDLFKSLHSEGRTIVIVTHDPNIASSTKKIIRIKDGELITRRKQ